MEEVQEFSSMGTILNNTLVHMTTIYYNLCYIFNKGVHIANALSFLDDRTKDTFEAVSIEKKQHKTLNNNFYLC